MTDDEEDSGDVYICHGCIGDSFLKADVRREGRRLKCNFCGKLRRAWPLDKLAERVREIVEEHFRLTPSNPYDEGYYYDSEMNWERRGEPVADVIANIADLHQNVAEAVRSRISEVTSWDAHDGAEEDPFGGEAHYEEGSPDTNEFQESWNWFRRQIQTRSRFFGRTVQQALDEIFGDLTSLKTWRGTPAIKEILPTDDNRFIFRGRIAYSESEIHEIAALKPVERLGPPPWRLARAGRMNAAGISVFYGAFDADTCIAELRAPVGSSVVVGRFEIIKPIRVLDLDILAKVTTDISWFSPEFTVRSNRAAFLRYLVGEISRPILPRDEEFEYLATQVVSEYLASCVEPSLDGIIFHSAQTGLKRGNIVLFQHAAEVEPYVLPEGAKVSVNTGWATDDDDDSIVVWEEMEKLPEPAKEDASVDEPPTFETILRSASLDKLDEQELEYDTRSGNPTLKLDVEKIKVFRIKAVIYEKVCRSVSRYRRTPADDEDLPF